MATYTLTDTQRARVKAAAIRAQESLAASERADVAVQTLIVKRPTFDEELDGMRPIIIVVIVNRGQDPIASISYGAIGRGAQDASANFASLVSDFQTDGVDIHAMNVALTEASR